MENNARPAPESERLYTVYATRYDVSMDEHVYGLTELPYANPGEFTDISGTVAKYVAEGFTDIRVYDSVRVATHKTEYNPNRFGRR